MMSHQLVVRPCRAAVVMASGECWRWPAMRSRSCCTSNCQRDPPIAALYKKMSYKSSAESNSESQLLVWAQRGTSARPSSHPHRAK